MEGNAVHKSGETSSTQRKKEVDEKPKTSPVHPGKCQDNPRNDGHCSPNCKEDSVISTITIAGKTNISGNCGKDPKDGLQ